MEENLILIPIIKEGLVVKIKPDTRYYSLNTPGNPREMLGKILFGENSWISVKWENGHVNNYNESDLEFEKPLDLAEINGNKLYFENPDLKIENMNQLLSALYRQNGNSNETFYKIESTGEFILQCKENKMRSFDDIFFLSNTYMPGITAKETFTGLLLYKVTVDHLKQKILFKSFSNCSTMRRIRYTPSFHNFHTVMNSVDCNKYDSIYGWRELFNMIGVNTTEELEKWYINKLNVRV